ncbi:hypothetical protein BH10BAC2_BH10BAC2_06310 [soil metagenome]
MLRLQNISFNNKPCYWSDRDGQTRAALRPIHRGSNDMRNNDYEFTGRELHTYKRPSRYKDLC